MDVQKEKDFADKDKDEDNLGLILGRLVSIKQHKVLGLIGVNFLLKFQMNLLRLLGLVYSFLLVWASSDSNKKTNTDSRPSHLDYSKTQIEQNLGLQDWLTCLRDDVNIEILFPN